MKITLSHLEKIDIIPDSAAISISIECFAEDHAASTSRVNLRQNEILESLRPLGIRSEHLQLVGHSTSLDQYRKTPDKACSRRELALKLRQPGADLVRRVLDRVAFDHGEVWAKLAWKIFDNSGFRHQLLKSALASLQSLAEAAAPQGIAKALELQIDDTAAQVNLRRAPSHELGKMEFCMIEPKRIEHESAAIEPGPIRFSLKITGVFEIE